MKCIKNIENGKVSRVSNDEAVKTVKKGGWRYIPKSEWKAAGRPK